jgi:hypothetical protein
MTPPSPQTATTGPPGDEHSSPTPHKERFKLGDASLNLSGDSLLCERFLAIVGDCSIESSAGLPVVNCVATPEGSIELTYPGPRRNLGQFLDTVAPSGSWSIRGDTVQFAADSNWRAYASNCAINLTFAIQPDVLFFHAASVAIGGRGLLIAGEKGAGKSTLSLALGARGHDLLGDEIAATRVSNRQLIPLRRSVSIREGARSALVEARLRDVPRLEEAYPDGSRRLRVRLSDLFPEQRPEDTPMDAMVFLRSFTSQTRLERFKPSFEHTALLQPLATPLWENGVHAAQRFRILRLLATSRCGFLDAGPIEESVLEIERFMEEQ